MGQFLGSMLFLPFFFTVAFLPVSAWLRRDQNGRKWWQIFLLIWLAISYLLVLINALGSMANLSDSRYVEAGYAGLAFLAVILVMLAFDVRRLFSGRPCEDRE